MNLGPNVYLKDKGVTFCTPLMLASQLCDLPLAQILVSFGADVNMRDNLCRNSLFYLLNSDNSESLEFLNFLVKNDVNVNEVDLDGNNALIVAINKDIKPIIGTLLANGAFVDHKVPSSGNSATHIAVANGDIEVIQMLLAYRPNLAIVNKNGETASGLAGLLNRNDIYSLLANDYSFRDSKEDDSNNSNMYQMENPHKSDMAGEYLPDRRHSCKNKTAKYFSTTNIEWQ